MTPDFHAGLGVEADGELVVALGEHGEDPAVGDGDAGEAIAERDAPYFCKRLLGSEEAGFAGDAVSLGPQPLGPVGRLCGGGQE